MHGLRGWAVAIIIVLHATIAVQYVPGDALQRGLVEGSYLALDVLFFTSGFVLFLPVVAAGRFGSVRAFLIRRFSRMVPPCWTCLLVIFLAYPVLISDVAAAKAAHSPSDYLIHLAFLQRMLLTTDTGLGVNGPLWALSMDLIFYLVLPLVAGAYLRRPLIGLVVAFGVSLAWRLLFKESGGESDLLIQFPLFLVDFAAGMTAAWALLRLMRGDVPRVARTPHGAGHRRLLRGAARARTCRRLDGSLPRRRLPGLGRGVRGLPAGPRCVRALRGTVAAACAMGHDQSTHPLGQRDQLLGLPVPRAYHVLRPVHARLRVNGTPRAALAMAAFAIPVTLVVAVLSYRLVELPVGRHGRALARRVGRGGQLESGVAPSRSAALGDARAE